MTVEMVQQGAFEQSDAALEAQRQQLVAAGNTTGACGVAAEKLGVQQIPHESFVALAQAGATVAYLSPDSLCSTILEDQAERWNDGKLPKGDTTEVKLSRLFDDLISTKSGKAEGAHCILEDYPSRVAETLSDQAGRAITVKPSRPRNPKHNDACTLIVQPDGSLVAVRFNDKTLKGQEKSSLELMRDIFAEAGTDHWDDTKGIAPFKELIDEAQHLRPQGRVRTPQPPTPQSTWRSGSVPEYDASLPSDPATLVALAAKRLPSHPGQIRTVDTGFGRHRTRPHGLRGRNWATNGEVILHMLRQRTAARMVGPLLARKREGGRGLVQLLASQPHVASQAYELYAGRDTEQQSHGQPVTIEQVREYMREPELPATQRLGRSLLVAAMHKGLFEQGGLRRRQVVTLLTPLLFPDQAPDRDKRKIAGQYLDVIKDRRSTPTDIAAALLNPHKVKEITWNVRHR